MKNDIHYYLSLDYPIQIERMSDGLYCASIPLLKGCKGYAKTIVEAIEELQGVKETLLELMLEQKKTIPEPVVRLEIPVTKFQRLSSRKRLDEFVTAG
ncbi:MAG: type II toxin-antitoxin system HicB family antitoxin [Ignavibacteriae bacterium]|nr:type II toxin-antitoxin system HicB family antitoxin [Ignavibacteriota bacterium]